MKLVILHCSVIKKKNGFTSMKLVILHCSVIKKMNELTLSLPPKIRFLAPSLIVVFFNKPYEIS